MKKFYGHVVGDLWVIKDAEGKQMTEPLTTEDYLVKNAELNGVKAKVEKKEKKVNKSKAKAEE